MFVPGEKEHPYPRVCAHRGYNTVLPESSLAAFGAAVGLGAPEIELDVRFSADEVVVACHDDRLERISDGIGKVGDFTLAELRKMDFETISKVCALPHLKKSLQNFPGRRLSICTLKMTPFPHIPENVSAKSLTY